MKTLRNPPNPNESARTIVVGPDSVKNWRTLAKPLSDRIFSLFPHSTIRATVIGGALPRHGPPCQNSPMADSTQPPRQRRAQMLSELVGRVIDPVTRQRGFAATELLAAWPEIVGARYADCTRPERIVWPKGEEMEGAPALLVLRVDGPRAILVQHEAGQILERVNAFLGYAAVGHLRILQAPVRAATRPALPPRPELSGSDEARLRETIDGLPAGPLRTSLEELGRNVIAGAREPPLPANKRHI